MRNPPFNQGANGLCERKPRVHVVGHGYLVNIVSSEPPRFHAVDKKRRCSCELGELCPSIEAVSGYLRNGGLRAPDPMPACPICGAETFRDRKWDGRYTKELGWRCTAGGLTHFLQAKAGRIQKALHCQQSAVSEHESAAGR